MYLIVYVDYILITRSSSCSIEMLVAQLYAKFSLKELGDLSYVLGIGAKRIGNRLLLHISCDGATTKV